MDEIYRLPFYIRVGINEIRLERCCLERIFSVLEHMN